MECAKPAEPARMSEDLLDEVLRHRRIQWLPTNPKLGRSWTGELMPSIVSLPFMSPTSFITMLFPRSSSREPTKFAATSCGGLINTTAPSAWKPTSSTLRRVQMSRSHTCFTWTAERARPGCPRARYGYDRPYVAEGRAAAG